MRWLGRRALREDGTYDAEGCRAGKEGGNDAARVGELVFLAAAFQVFLERHPGGEAESVAGNPLDERMGLGERLVFAAGRVPLVAELLSQRPEARGSEGQGELALKGFDAIPDPAQGHDFTFQTCLAKPGWVARFSFSRSFPFISTHCRLPGRLGLPGIFFICVAFRLTYCVSFGPFSPVAGEFAGRRGCSCSHD